MIICYTLDVTILLQPLLWPYNDCNKGPTVQKIKIIICTVTDIVKLCCDLDLDNAIQSVDKGMMMTMM